MRFSETTSPVSPNKELGIQIEKMRGDPPKYTPAFMERETVVCECGKRRVIAPDMFFPTGVNYPGTGQPILAIDPLCPECQKELAGTARLVCVTCSPPRVFMRLKPRTDPVTGLVITPSRVYHTARCAVCVPGATTSELIEQKILLQRKKI